MHGLTKYIRSLFNGEHRQETISPTLQGIFSFHDSAILYISYWYTKSYFPPIIVVSN